MPALNPQFVLLVTCVLASISLVYTEPTPVGSRFIDAVSDIFGVGRFGGNRFGSCNSPCPPWNCIDDSAMIHGVCCGCASIFDYNTYAYHCPPDLQCPSIYTSPLCTDYQWMRRCCCSS